MTLKKTYSDNDRAELDKYNKKVTGASGNRYFVVFRIGKKMKNFNMIQRYQFHVNRESNVLNANPKKTKYNRILIGSSNIVQDVKDYIKDVPFIRSNGNIAFDLVLTAHHEFFNELQPSEKEIWIKHNIEYIKKTFSNNCISAILHVDETALHFHVLICPKFWNEKQKRYELQSNKYIDGVEKLRDFQTNYADHMQQKFRNLMRGIRGSKQHHTSIQTFYSILTKKLDIQDDRSILAYAQQNYLFERRIKALERSLRIMNENGDTEKLLKRLDAADKKSKDYKDITKAIIKKYNLKEPEINELIDKVQSKNKSNKSERERK